MPIPLAALPAIIQGSVGAAQVIGGAAGILTSKRPEYEIPDALRQSLALAQLELQSPYMPGYTQARESMDMTAANQLMAAREGGNVQESIQTIAGSQQKGYRDLAQMGGEYQRQDLRDVQSILGQISKAQDAQYMYNELAPYADKRQESRDVFGAGLENVFTGFDALGASGLNLSKPTPSTTTPTTPATITSADQLSEEQKAQLNAILSQFLRLPLQLGK